MRHATPRCFVVAALLAFLGLGALACDSPTPPDVSSMDNNASSNNASSNNSINNQVNNNVNNPVNNNPGNNPVNNNPNNNPNNNTNNPVNNNPVNNNPGNNNTNGNTQAEVPNPLLPSSLVPAAIVRFGFKARLSEFGLTRRGFVRHLPIYGALYVAVLPLVLFAARQPAFLKAYPFYGRGHLDLPGLAIWELAYGLQFFALEFFFRGFLLHATRARLGWYSVLVMTIPYCMIHFGKPAPETFGAIIAGIVLGTLALWTRSIWPGVLVHISVAWTMDALAVLGKL